MNNDVLIYVSKFREYFKKNIEAREYFLIPQYPDEFFDLLGEVATSNIDKGKNVELSKEQFEEIRETLKKKIINDDPSVFIINNTKFDINKIIHLN